MIIIIIAKHGVVGKKIVCENNNSNFFFIVTIIIMCIGMSRAGANQPKWIVDTIKIRDMLYFRQWARFSYQWLLCCMSIREYVVFWHPDIIVWPKLRWVPSDIYIRVYVYVYIFSVYIFVKFNLVYRRFHFPFPVPFMTSADWHFWNRINIFDMLYVCQLPFVGRWLLVCLFVDKCIEGKGLWMWTFPWKIQLIYICCAISYSHTFISSILRDKR